MILLKKIQLNNFLSHAKTELTFHPNEKILIDGLSGHGKSAIFEAILWALYGQGRVDNRAIIYRGAKKVSVILELQKEGETVIITREATVSGKHILEVVVQSDSGQRSALPLSGIRETQNWIDKELIGASYLLFINSAAYLQDNKESFVMQTAPRRKELLLEIVKAETYAKYYENARNALQVAQNEENLIKGRLMTLEAQIAPLNAKIGQKQGFLSDIETCTKKIEELDPAKKTFESLKENYTRDSLIIFNINSNIDREQKAKLKLEERLFLKKDISVRNAAIKILEKTKEQLNSDRNKLITAGKNEEARNQFMEKRPSTENRLQEYIQTLQQEIRLIQAEPICPAGKDCPYSGNHEEQIEGKEQQIADYRLKSSRIETSLREWEKEKEQLPPKIDINALINDIQINENKVKEKEQEIFAFDSIETERPRIEKEVTEKTEIINKFLKEKYDIQRMLDAYDINKIANGLLEIYDQQRDLADKVSRGQAMVESIEQSEAELATIQEQIQTLNTKEIKSLQDKAYKIGLIKDAFSSRGIETMVIDYLLSKLEDQINKVLIRLSDFRVRLDTQRKSADGTGTVEGLFITIINDQGQEMSFESYSGGEKLRITIAITEALSSLGKTIGFRIIDEAILGLSSEMVQDFIKILFQLQIQYPQILCISHLPEVKEAFEKNILIKKLNGISKIS